MSDFVVLVIFTILSAVSTIVFSILFFTHKKDGKDGKKEYNYNYLIFAGISIILFAILFYVIYKKTQSIQKKLVSQPISLYQASISSEPSNSEINFDDLEEQIASAGR